MPTIEQIDIWRESPSEHQGLEFKEAKKQFDNRKLFRYCVAISNEGGGHLILGIANKLPRLVVGTSAFQSPIKVTEQIFRTIGFRVDVEEVHHPDGRVLVFSIPPRPKGTAYHYEGSYIMRSGECLIPMTEDQLRKIFAEGAPEWLEEPAISSLSSQKVIELLDTQTYFELLGLPYPSSRVGVLERLVHEGLIDEIPDGYSIRRLGAILLAKRLTDFSIDISRKAPSTLYTLNLRILLALLSPSIVTGSIT
ncbi:MAG: putative DNA binding domain-containing protein [Candidatus Sabulitectum sp.]|nr:putative DNA binding domain-containing protein [Candidatus Sabulitectum sp.]